MDIKRIASLLVLLTISYFSSATPVLAENSSASDSSTINLSAFQQFKTSAARSVKYFKINGTPYFAIAQFAIDFPGGNVGLDGGDSDTNSLIYRWDGKQFKLFQTLPSHGGRDFTFFQIGKENYLALANLRAGSGPYNVNTYSTVYRWDGCMFTPIQDFETYSAQEWTSFKIDNKIFLAVANYAKAENGKPNFEVNSNIYAWDGSQFNLFQSIPTHAAFSWSFFKLGNKYYLAVANGTGNTSDVYVWDGEKFSLFQNLPSEKARDIVHFQINNEDYVAIANLDSDSLIYKWDNNKFVPYQTVTGAGGRRFVFFTQNHHQYLIKMNYMVNRKLVYQSQIYTWDGKNFILTKEFPTSGATDADYFTHDGKNYLAVANGHKSETSFEVDSVIYEVKTQTKKGQ